VRREAKNTGIGIGVAPDNGAMMITYVYAGSPAAKVGLNPGDRILEVNGKAISAGVQSIAGEEGSTVEIKVQKATGKIEDLSLVRKKYSTVKPEEFTLVDPDTAMLTVHTFDLTYNADRVETLVRKGIGKRNFILDLRGNGGGAVYNLQHLLSCFLAKDVEIGTFISRRVVEDYKEKTGKPGTDLADIANFAKRKVKVTPKSDVPRFVGNMVVLVNGSSGSASEMAAAALREVGGATIIGRKSAGAVLVSIIAPLTSGFTLQYPLSDYVTIKGLRLEGKGVTPDIEVNQPAFLIPNTPDTAVAKAQEVFQRIAQIDKL
jgi:carboxyl-terminal processing protease